MSATLVKSGYAPVNGLQMYYEIHGEGKPLVLIHGGGSSIYVTFGNILPHLAQYTQIIAVDLQAHGRTSDRDAPETFEQDADDVAALIEYLGIQKANIFGFSNGANTTMQVAVRHPDIVDHLIVASGFYKRDGVYPWLWDFLQEKAELSNMPQPLQDAYMQLNNDVEGLRNMHNKDRDRMCNFKDWSDDDIRGINSPTLIMIGDRDVVTPEHAVAMYRLLPNARVCILPGGHGDYIGELLMNPKYQDAPERTAGIIKDFLEHNA
ncbi:alpha/beta fold hydrolase [Mucilaginibacter agri]|uniref:Alpha/beta fold hydrolase n=1 Tax=Mucilaginibacter agri TaxID=2695265 RepID=A0A965ZGH3_9SPHI|nr:alpha/beta hydrolase [Mucilaginibacter agri]NCD69733.1 alpha/beta fold hydrolase [Mucilaginibacter agri]